MMLSNKVYDTLKWICLIALPAIATLYSAVASIWELPGTAKVVGTITAIGTFLGALIKVSTKSYNATKSEEE